MTGKERLEETLAAADPVRTADQLDRRAPPAGDHHHERQMRMIDR